MEIRTRHDDRTAREAAPAPVPEGSRYLRRKPVQKVRRSRLTMGTLLRGLRLFARAAAAGALTAGIVVAVAYVFSSDNFSLKEVKITGCQWSDPSAVEAVVRREFPRHLLKIRLRDVRDRLERETWVRQADIRRVLPSTLVVHITERVPAVIFEFNGQLMVADREAVLLDRYKPVYGKLDVPVFRGLANSGRPASHGLGAEDTARLRLGIRLLEELESGSPALARNISEVDLSDPANAKVLLVDDTAEIFLGDRDFLKRFGTFMANLPHYKELKSQYQEIASVDMRYEGQIIYRPVLDAEQPMAEDVTASNSAPQR
ncbi:MAG: FtsQ-type POTRA domain-containing protein [Acidobacteria bacterium]|nr:FtsQ-type POTRA domain-containing protein [Acidobacteriota bacterium]